QQSIQGSAIFTYSVEKNRSDSEVHMDYKDDDTNRNNETNDENADGMSSNNLFFIVYYQLFQFFDVITL
ncbi:3544_t:CDS:1, partial [Rhizophagus irregularis]